MTRTTRALAFPRAFSVMVGLLTGRVVDVLRVLGSTKTYRASVADTTRELILKGMAVTAAEHALGYATGRPCELTTGLLADVYEAMGEEFEAGLAGREPDEVLQAVLSRMWPEIVAKMEKIDTRKPGGKAMHRRLVAGPPLTRQGRPETMKEIRTRALSDIVAGRAEAPRLMAPRTVQEARERARLETAADRLAVDRGVPVAELLAETTGGRAAGMETVDETAAAGGWAQQLKKARGGGQ